MRIKKLNENFDSDELYLVIKTKNDGYDRYSHLFGSYKATIDYILYDIYTELKDKSKKLIEF